MKEILGIFRKELLSYFSTPIAYVFITAFVVLSCVFCFHVGSFFARGQADLVPFFTFHPWLYLFFIPAISMRLWAEESKSGTIELLFTLPLTTTQIIIGKFLAAWTFVLISLCFTFPLWITVNYLGSPDNGVILASYIGSFFIAGAFLSIGLCFSALTNNQIIAFILGCLVCFLFVVSGTDIVLNFFKSWVSVDFYKVIASFSFLSHFGSLAKGLMTLNSIVFISSVIALFLFLNKLILDIRKD